MTLQLPRFGLDYVLAYPEGFDLPDSTIESAKAAAKKSGGSFEITHDMDSAFKDADIIYPKSWGPWMTTTDADEAKAMITKHEDWITDERKMALAKDDAIFMHPLPADRNVEVTDAVMDGPNSVIFDESENKMYVCESVMALTMANK
jgi:N-acetylornithine carbamoyltransferase